FFRLPEMLIEADGAAVESVGAVVDGNLIGLAIERELALADAVAVAANDRAEVSLGVVEKALQRIVAENDVGHLAGAVRSSDADDLRPVCHDPHFNLAALERIDWHRLSIRGMTPYRHLHFSLRNSGKRHCGYE